MLQMVRHERLNEIVPVVVARLHAQRELLSGCRGRGGEFFGQQLLVREKLIGPALVDLIMQLLLLVGAGVWLHSLLVQTELYGVRHPSEFIESMGCTAI